MDYKPKTGQDGKVRYVQCAPDMWLPEQARASGPAPGLEIPSGAIWAQEQEYHVRAAYQLRPFLLRYMLVSVELYVQKGPEESGIELYIDTNTYRALTLEAIQSGLADSLGRRRAELPSDALTWSAVSADNLLIPEQDEEFVIAARAYAAGSVSGRAPQKAVAEKLGVSIATAGRRVRTAMDRGYVPVIIDGESDAKTS